MTAQQWLKQLFEFEYCAECGGDWQDHIACAGPFDLPFAMCKFAPLVPGSVIFRHGRVRNVTA